MSATPAPLLGSWSATRWVYTSRRDPQRSLDVVCDLGGVITLSLSAGTYVLSTAGANRDPSSIGGRCEMAGDRLGLMRDGNGETQQLRFRIADETLSLTGDGATWDFDGGGVEEPADFVAVLVRL